MTPTKEPVITKPRKPTHRLTNSDKSRALDLRLSKGLTYQEIGDILKTSKQTIHRHFATLLPDSRTEIYRQNRADILSHAQVRLLSNVTDAKLKKSSARDLIVSTGILYDKERLERDQSTVNVAYDAASDRAQLAELKALQASAVDVEAEQGIT